MLVTLIEDGMKDRLDQLTLTQGKIYKVIEKLAGYYIIINDLGIEEIFFKHRFKIADKCFPDLCKDKHCNTCKFMPE